MRRVPLLLMNTAGSTVDTWIKKNGMCRYCLALLAVFFIAFVV